MKILVPVDYSDHCRNVVHYASDLAEVLGGTVEVVHVWEAQPNVPANLKVVTSDGRTSSVAELVREQAESSMKDFLGTCSAPGTHARSHSILKGSTAAAIVKHATTGKFDLIVIGTAAQSAFDRFVLGSVAERVLRTSRIPVVTIPGSMFDPASSKA